jgi:hypothetical protein
VNLTKAKYDVPVTLGVQKATTTTSSNQRQRPVAYAFMYVMQQIQNDSSPNV